MTKIKFAGVAAVDSGQLMVIDPCYCKYWEDKRAKRLDEKFGIEREKHPDLEYGIACKKNQLKFSNGNLAAVVVKTSGDGFYPVLVEYDDDSGEPTAIKIALNISIEEAKNIEKTNELIGS